MNLFTKALRYRHWTGSRAEYLHELEEPIRSELFSAERLEQHAESLALAQRVTKTPDTKRKLASRVRINGRLLLESYEAIAKAVQEKRAITPAAEWLIDNFHVIEEQITDINDHLPDRFYKELPKLADGYLVGYPRVYGIAWALAAHTDSRFDPELLMRFVRAYQRAQPLTIGELWAVPITLRIVLIENLRRLSLRIVCSQSGRELADQFADQYTVPSQQIIAATALRLPEEPLRQAFAVQLVQRLRYHHPSFTATLDSLNEWFTAQGTNIDEIVQLEHTSQAAANLTVRNVITSMRAISAFDWQTFFEDISLVDECLRAHPNYVAMDFLSRDRYRHAIEDLAKKSPHSELEIAQTVLTKTERIRSLSQQNCEPIDERIVDPGYYLIGGGRFNFEKEIGFRTSLKQRLLRAYVAYAMAFYLGSILFITLGLAALPLRMSINAGLAGPGLWVLGLLVLFPASDIALTLVNRVISKVFAPRHLPRLKLAAIPPQLRTVVVIPTLLAHEAGVSEQLKQLEIHYLANPEGEVFFALLSDWTDADTESVPADDALLAQARHGIAALNAQYGPVNAIEGEQRFFLFHRQRRWNESEQKWLGWERKRGKLHEFNRLLRGATDTSFLPLDGNSITIPVNIRYVITLDADTRLPMGAVRQLVGTAAHALNQPRFDPHLQRVVEGYSILQPRVTPTLPKRIERSIFQRIYSGASGLDPYAAAVSDLYQDLFGVGIYTGKGLYDIDAFEKALAGRIPQNALLSHDLFEGVFARCALVSDSEFFEDFPSHSEVAAARTHRWVRGDWQLLPWIFGRTGGNLPVVGRWQMLDNLRRSLSAPAALFTLLLSWAIPLAPEGVWLAFILTALAFPAVLNILAGLLPQRRHFSLRSHLAAMGEDILLGCGHIVASVMLLAHQAWLMLDAILRTLVRLWITRRKLLEWVTAAQAKSAARLAFTDFHGQWLSATLIVLVASAILFLNPSAMHVAAPLVVLWWLAPLYARAMSLPPNLSKIEPLSPSDISVLRLTARRIWRFFTTFVTAQDHHLPPDNFQEDPQPVVAHRSSPTNFGLYLLSIIAARDFGWLGLYDMTDKLSATLTTLQNLERHHGHFYNWYDTRDLRPLEPKYLSSVDSGNLAGHLIALAQACTEMQERPVFTAAALIGIADTLDLLDSALNEVKDNRRTLAVTTSELRSTVNHLRATLLDHTPTYITMNLPSPLERARATWNLLNEQSESLLDLARTFAAERGETDNEVLTWARILRTDILSHTRDIDALLPWLSLPIATLEWPIPEETALWEDLKRQLNNVATLGEISICCKNALDQLDAWQAYAQRPGEALETSRLLSSLTTAFKHSEESCGALIGRLNQLATTAHKFFAEMDFRFLFDFERKLFPIGYQVSEAKVDPSYYDLLMSEARLTSFIAIAKHDVPMAHWFRMGRRLTPTRSGPILISWSGSMFEYLMPSLVLYTPRGSLLDQTCRRVVRQQINYGTERGVPWGISESAYNVRDRELTYQYSDFGVPGLGLKRGLGQELVIAPYATALAAMYDANVAVANFQKLKTIGALGRYGFYEAVDFTSSRRLDTQSLALVRAYMAHHQGMSLVALDNVLHGGIMRHRFHREPIMQAAELLLQERIPRMVRAMPPRASELSSEPVKEPGPVVSRRFDSAHLPIPITHLLSNGRYAVMVTSAGSGYSTWGKFAVTRWREDVTCDAWGSYLYLRDVTSGKIWSVGYQPTAVEPDEYEVIFSEDRARFVRRDGVITCALEIIVSPEDHAEIRRLSLSNDGLRPRELEITSYAEIVLAPQPADIAHPAFSNLFVQTEFVPEVRGLIATRRPRSANDPSLWAAHALALRPDPVGNIEYETDRMRFLGRGRTVRAPLSVMDGRPLSNTVGAVLDPIFSLRTRVRVAAGETVHLTFATVVAASRAEVIDLADKYHDLAAFERVSALAWTHAQVQLHHLRIHSEEAQLFQYLANRVLYSDPSLRPSGEFLKMNRLSAAGLWPHRISGDRPIVLLRVARLEDRDIVLQLLRAHEYWHTKRLAVDLVIVNEKASSYLQDLQALVESMVSANQALAAHEAPDERGTIFILRTDLLSKEDSILLQTVARAVLVGGRGSLAEQVIWRAKTSAQLPREFETELDHHEIREEVASSPSPVPPPPKLEFFNGLGGFAESGREYVVVLAKGQRTPAPWINVIANPDFGFMVSESGSGCTWCFNSRENQLTPWSNDPVSDPSAEAFYIRDEESGELWNPTALPIRSETGTYIARHGQGYSRFEHRSRDIQSELLQLVSWNDPIKISQLRLRNLSRRTRWLSVTAYVEWALGASRANNARSIVTENDPATAAIFAHNPWNIDFGQRIAFAALTSEVTAWTCDRTEFIGRNGSLNLPAALLPHGSLSNRNGAGYDPCAALQTAVELEPGAEIELVFLLGQSADRETARALVHHYRSVKVEDLLATITRKWDRLLTKVEIDTPDRAMDIMLNRWLLYQTLSCRFWARAGFYQAGGAYGFRDQLQDSMALVMAAPELARAHLLRTAAQQFVEGDVQHWWHPHSGRGVRTHFSDDRLWLPYAVTHYINVTGDQEVLDEIVPFIEGPALSLNQEDTLFQAIRSEQRATLYQHCALALDRSLATGAHGLPLMGGGDWNDGMNRVGQGGKGESVWLAWFLHTVLGQFSQFAEMRGETATTQRWRAHANALKEKVEAEGWDGAWYRRAYFDDGTPLGSAANAECRIDSVAQCWAVISGAADPERMQRAMNSVEEYLLRRGEDLIVLFTPPFDRTPADPGYIKGYLPGVRENGGQYTHAAIWCLIAYALLGDGDQASELFKMLNPINRTTTRAGLYAYKVEPYAVAADVYSEPPNVRRGGWTWYTGSAGWLYRAGLEWMLGLKIEASNLCLDPCIPREWQHYTLRYRHGSTYFHIHVENPRGVMRGVTQIEVDGQIRSQTQATARIPLVDDGKTHRVRVILG